MQLTEKEFKILIVVIGLIIGVALSFMLYAMSHTLFSFIMVPVCVLIVYFQQVRPLKNARNDSD